MSPAKCISVGFDDERTCFGAAVRVFSLTLPHNQAKKPKNLLESPTENKIKFTAPRTQLTIILLRKCN